jgi:hypothetical protein
VLYQIAGDLESEIARNLVINCYVRPEESVLQLSSDEPLPSGFLIVTLTQTA